MNFVEWIPGVACRLFAGLLVLIGGAAPGQVLHLPDRATNAPSPAEILARIAPLDLAARESEIAAQVMAGNVPSFLRRLAPVEIAHVGASGTNRLTFYVTPDYLAVGSDANYLLVPISPALAQRLADSLDCMLPTRKMVDEIYRAAPVKLAPVPIPPSPAMTTVSIFSNHNATVQRQRAAMLSQWPLGTLVAGHKKDVVLARDLPNHPGKVAIYGWHRTNGIAIQPLYLGHAATWVDYSQCTRLVSQQMTVNGAKTTAAALLGDTNTASLLSDEGVLTILRYPTNLPSTAKELSYSVSAGSGWTNTGSFNERTFAFAPVPDVQITVNAPADLPKDRPLLLIIYALPNGSTTAQTIGKVPKPGDDSRFDIQHIGAQTRFLRSVLTNQVVVIAYFENSLKAWPAWRRAHGDQSIPALFSSVKSILSGHQIQTVLTGHSGGGSLAFGYLNALEKIPDDVVRIAFLDSDYAYDQKLGHTRKLAEWLKSPAPHFLCVLAYNDAVALLNGKTFVSPEGGSWGRSRAMQRDLAQIFQFEHHEDKEFQRFSAEKGRIQFLLKENPEKQILHTVQVERNGFIHAMLTGTAEENRGYEYYADRVYSRWIQE